MRGARACVAARPWARHQEEQRRQPRPPPVAVRAPVVRRSGRTAGGLRPGHHPTGLCLRRKHCGQRISSACTTVRQRTALRTRSPPSTLDRSSMITETQIQQVIGTTAVEADGDKIGKVSEIYLDDETGRPEWATVHTGLFGTKETFVPLAQADLSGDTLRFPYDKAKVKYAPKIDTDGHLSPQEEQELYSYYGLGSGTGTETTTQTQTTGTAGMAGTAGTAGTTETAGVAGTPRTPGVAGA